MAYPGIACVLIGVTVATFLYYIFGNNEERSTHTYNQNRSRYEESNNYYESGYDSGWRGKKGSNSADSEQCSICLSALTTRDKILLNCNHAFHRDCINQWKRSSAKNSCPNCRGYIG